MSLGGRCWECDFFRENQCKKAGNFLSQIDDPICLQKINVILLTDLVDTVNDYVYGDKE